MLLPNPERLALARMRGAIDRVDDGLIVLLAARRRLVRVVAALKPRAGVPPRDLARPETPSKINTDDGETIDIPTDLTVEE